MSEPGWDDAVARDDVATVGRLLATGVDVDARDGQGQTALMRAAHRGHLQTVEVLLAAGAALDATAKYRLSALMLAIVAGHPTVARALARAGADLTLTGSGAPGFAGKTAYELAATRGDMDELLSELRPTWHALLTSLPAGVVPQRRAVVPPELQASPQSAASAGWEQLTVELSMGGAGLRHVLVVLDATECPISASDTVLYSRERPGGAVELHQENIGGRLEADGTFRGTRWTSFAMGRKDDEEDPPWQSTPGQPSAEEAAALRALVDEVMRRRPPR